MTATNAPPTTPDTPADVSPVRLDRAADRALRGPLAAAVVGLCAVELATWIPHYLTWPWFADHDVFATAAQAWDAGQRPYRDILGNNFPATIYLFWILGKVAGWGRTAAFYAADAAMVLALGILLLAWSRRRFGRLLPGAIGYLTFLAYYLGLDYSQAAQRDWQGPFFAASALLVAEAWPDRAGRLVSAIAMALAVTFRPQTVLFLPALVVAIDLSNRPRGGPLRETIRASLGWGLALAAGLALMFAPLALAGVLPDFARGVRLAAYGGSYSQLTPASFLKEFATQLAPFKISSVIVLLALASRASPRSSGEASTWLLATAGALLYRPLSPIPHAYLGHPLMLVWSIDVAILTQMVLESGDLTPSRRLAVVLLLLGLGATGRPRFCNPIASVRAIPLLIRGQEPEISPLGYTANPAVGKAATYAWDDYRRTLEYLREHTGPDVRVANALKGIAAIAGPSGRRTAFPAESVGWLYIVKHDDEARFADALERTPDSVVVWSPAERAVEPNFSLDLLTPVILEHYEPEARFGTIEVWRRKANGR